MASVSPWNGIILAWILFVAYWIISARNVKRTAQAESMVVRLPHILVMAIAYMLLFETHLPLRPLNQRVLPRNDALEATGILLTWSGVALAIWARVHIGQYWSARVTLKEDHKIISTGPYAYMRHPIYTGLLLATLGTAMVRDQWQCLVAFALVLSAHVLKARKEERLLAGKFGQDYEQYRLSTGFLVPRFR